MIRIAYGLAAVALLASGARSEEETNLAVLKREIEQPDESKAREAAIRLADLEGPAAFEMILDELAIGAPPKVQGALLSALGYRKEPRAWEVLALYVRNRNPELRKKAVVAMGELADPRAVGLLIAALSDAVTEVRSVAAQALGRRREAAAEAALIKLLTHKDEAAVEAVAAIGNASTARKLGELFGQIPDSLLAETLSGLLKRQDFGPEPIRVEVVKTLGKVPGPSATEALKEYLAATSGERDKERGSHLEAKKAIEQRGGH